MIDEQGPDQSTRDPGELRSYKDRLQRAVDGMKESLQTAGPATDPDDVSAQEHLIDPR
jgi:hypothetical protein